MVTKWGFVVPYPICRQEVTLRFAGQGRACEARPVVVYPKDSSYFDGFVDDPSFVKPD